MEDNSELRETVKKKHPNPVGRPPLGLNEDYGFFINDKDNLKINYHFQKLFILVLE